MSWAADPACEGVGIAGRIGFNLGRKRYFSLEFLTDPPGREAVSLFNESACLSMQNPYREFSFCAEPGGSMVKAKEVLDEHLGVLGTERQLLQMSAKIGRLIAASGIKDAGLLL